MDVLELSFFCECCGRHEFTVRYREADEPLGFWLSVVVQPAMTVAHIMASPNCPSYSADLQLPLPSDANIGKRTIN